VCCQLEVTELRIVTLLEFGPAAAHAFGHKSGIRERTNGSKLPPPPLAQQLLVSQGLFVVEGIKSHLELRLSIKFLWTSDQRDAETST
jgi:hypothetical protein